MAGILNDRPMNARVKTFYERGHRLSIANGWNLPRRGRISNEQTSIWGMVKSLPGL
jgi:hypothetical protein